MLRAMVGIGIVCGLLIVVTYEGTLPRIERLKSASLEQAIYAVLPGTTKKMTFYLDEEGDFIPVRGEKPDGPVVHAGYNQEHALTGLAIEASGMGFADVLRVLYGYDPGSEAIIGFHVLESKETPGLGDKIEKDAGFLANFEALDVSLNADKTALKHAIIPVKHGAKENPWEIDGITGATISSRAIGDLMGASAAVMIPRIYQQQEVFKLMEQEIQDNE